MGVSVRCFVGGALAFVLVLASASLRAEPSAADRETARALLDRADALIDEQKYSEALEAYRAAHALMGVPSTGIEVAKTLTKLGRIVEAKRIAGEVAAIPVSPDEPEPFALARRDARALFDELDKRVPRLTVKAPGAEQVIVDATIVDDFHSEKTLELEPGDHVLTATKAGKSLRKTVHLAERDERTVSFENETRAPAKPSHAPRPAPIPKPEPEPSSNSLRTVGWIGVGVGATGLVFGAVTGALALQSKSKLDDGGCSDRRCSASQAGDVDRYNTLRTLSSAGLIGGAVVAAAGAILVGVSGERSPQRERGKWRTTLSQSSSGAGFTF